MNERNMRLFQRAKEIEINRKEIAKGDVVYFLGTNRQHEKTIKFGIVEEHYTNEICLQLYDVCERRMIDGLPVEQIDFPTKWKKLPKGWTWNTELFKMSSRPFPSGAEGLKINNPADILKGIEQGLYVKVQSLDYGHFETIIDKEKGWRIERRYSNEEYNCPYLSIRFHDVYRTYEQAQAVLDEEMAELKRQSELSEYDWTVEKIDDKLDFWAYANNISDEEKQRYRDWIFSLDRVEDVEVRMFGNNIQWKYWKNSRWMNIVI